MVERRFGSLFKRYHLPRLLYRKLACTEAMMLACLLAR
jgi:hypothetical protein